MQIILSGMEETLKALEGSQKAIYQQEEEVHNIMENLGTSFNGFSLESSFLSAHLENIGEWHDSSASKIGEILLAQKKLSESVHELGLYVASVKIAIKNYSIRQAEFESISSRTNITRSELLQYTSSGSLASSPDHQVLEEDEENLAKELESLRQDIVDEVYTWLANSQLIWQQNLVLRSNVMREKAASGLQEWDSTA